MLIDLMVVALSCVTFFGANTGSDLSQNLEEEKSLNSNDFVRRAAFLNSSADERYNLEEGEIVTADKEVPYSWYFKYNKDKFSKNTAGSNGQGICGYTAASMILTYNEVFKSAGYFSEAQSNRYLRKGVGEFGKVVPEIVDSFPRSVWGNDIGNSTPGDIATAIDIFMVGKQKSYGKYCYYWLMANIDDVINDGVPAIYFGNFNNSTGGKYSHAVTVYGKFNNGKLLCHWGWDGSGYSQVIINKLGLFDLGGIFALYNKHEHVHKYYFKDSSNYLRCGCGAYSL